MESILLYHATYGTPEQVAKLYAALATAQGQFPAIAKNRTVEIPIKDKTTGAIRGSYTFRYADLEEINSKTRGPLSANGLATLQLISSATSGNGTAIFSRLVHADGACIETELPLPSQEKRDIKDYGATVSYLRRYAKTALLDIAADDDLDANGENGENGGNDDSPKQATATTEPRTNKPEYPDAKLESMLPKWGELVREGKKTADQVIATVSSGNTLSQSQIARIRALETTQGEQA